jgi:hypothetical protein
LNVIYARAVLEKGEKLIPAELHPVIKKEFAVITPPWAAENPVVQLTIVKFDITLSPLPAELNPAELECNVL